MAEWRKDLKDRAVVEPHPEALDLRHCVRDLVAVSALPAMWRDYEPARIAESAASASVKMLVVDFVYVSSGQQ
jgi:hypothetical protein